MPDNSPELAGDGGLGAGSSPNPIPGPVNWPPESKTWEGEPATYFLGVA